MVRLDSNCPRSPHVLWAPDIPNPANLKRDQLSRIAKRVSDGPIARRIRASILSTIRHYPAEEKSSARLLTMPRPGNLWVVLARPAATTCSAAPVNNGFSDITRYHGPSVFPGGFFSAQLMSWALKHSLIYLPTASRASPGRYASEPRSNGRSERSSVIGSLMLRTIRSAPLVGP